MSPALALFLSSLPAQAQAPVGLAPHLEPSLSAVQDEPTPTAETVEEPATTTRTRDYQMQINARFRYLTVPGTLLDIGTYSEKDSGFPQTQSRPKVRGLGYGAELVFDTGPSNYVIWGEYLDSKMKEGYWDDVDDTYVDHEDGDYVVPLGLGVGALGFTFMHELEVVPVGPEDGPVGLSFLFGAGLGIGFVTGELEVWHVGGDVDNVQIDCGETSPAYERVDSCASDGFMRIPKVLPLLDLSASMRFNFSDHAHLRIDGGLHDMLFVGTAVGAIF